MRHTHSFKLMVLATALAAGSVAMAQDSTASREQRMDEALQNYRSTHGTPNAQAPMGDPRNPHPGPVARAEDSAKRGMHRAGQTVKHGAERTGAAIRRGGEKIKEKVEN